MLTTVDIWHLNKQFLLSFDYDWQSILQHDESLRADRFHFEEDKTSFIIYHACKRLILANYLKHPAKEIDFATHTHGKPFLPNSDLYFNLSHTKNMATIAVTQHHELGVDIEIIKNTDNFLQIAERFFHVHEYHELLNLDNAEQQLRHFYVLWTSKEAALKATGKGISNGLNKLCNEISDNITLLQLNCPRNYSASLAIMGPKKEVRYQDIRGIL